jgi:hypothetical protein
MGAGGFELCLSFLLGASVGYAFRAAISSIRRAKSRQRRREELARSAALDLQEQAGTQYLAASPALAGAAAAIIREIESGIDSPREPAS